MGEDIPIAFARPADGAPSETVSVVAPSDLPAAYEFQVAVGDSNKTVRVPPGGVKQGQEFPAAVVSSSTRAAAVPGGIPTGHWRDGLCNCCAFGCCHPMFCLATCFGMVVLGQVLTRLGLDWCGRTPNGGIGSSNAFSTVIRIFIANVVLNLIVSSIAEAFNCVDIGDPETQNCEQSATYQVVTAIIGIWNCFIFIFMLIATMNLRSFIRNKYNIPPSACGDGGCDDCCCAFWCTCCSLQQMARHTHDYASYPVGCCSDGCCSKAGKPVGAVDPGQPGGAVDSSIV